jgi:hypothetical protein
MDEKQFIYERLHYLNDRVEFLYKTIEQQQDLLGKVANILEQMQSPEYAKQQSKMAEMNDIAEKIKFIRSLNKK